MLAAALLSLAVDAPTTADGWVRVINIKPSVGGQPAPTFVGTSFYCDSGNEECSQPDCWSPVWYENELYNTACEASSCIASPTPSTARARR